jgi:squalene-hopene/tetraprenyl-beta-curcumene cyclase
MRSAMHWLLARQIDKPGDWSATVDARPGGWCFEHANDFYPDVDDTAMAVIALWRQFSQASESSATLPPGLQLLAEAHDSPRAARERIALLEKTTSALRRAEEWLRAMQNRDGGWGAFDRDNNRQFLCQVPFADHNAMIDPSTPDLTGRVLEALGTLGRRIGDTAVDRAIAYLRETQEADGSWFGRWGVNYIYGTWQVLVGLAAVGVASDDPFFTSGANWLLAWQQPCGGWGESPDSYDDPALRGQGPVTASQTAWAILGLLAAGLEHHPAVVRGIRYLVSAQSDDGTWHEPEFTGTGFPRVFYLR